MVERISTGIKGFDKLIEGGLPKESVSLVSGPPGTGKSIFCMQIAYNFALSGKNALYIFFEQNDFFIEEQLNQFGLNPNKVKNNLKLLLLDPNDPSIMNKIVDETKKHNAELIVLDSLASLASNSLTQPSNLTTQQIMDFVVPVPVDVEQFSRMKVKMILDTIRSTKATALLTSEIVKGQKGYSRDTLSEFLCDAIFLMSLVEGKKERRIITIPKIRLTNQCFGTHYFSITKKGIVIKPNC